MPKLKNIPEGRSPVFESLHENSKTFNETNDCSVKAACVAFDISYEDAHEVMRMFGRKNRGGMLRTFDAMAFIAKCHDKTLTWVSPIHFITKYPLPHCKVLKSVTSLHPYRFPEVWQDGQTYIMLVRGHVFTIRNGINHDWSCKNALRAISIYRIDNAKE